MPNREQEATSSHTVPGRCHQAPRLISLPVEGLAIYSNEKLGVMLYDFLCDVEQGSILYEVLCAVDVLEDTEEGRGGLNDVLTPDRYNHGRMEYLLIGAHGRLSRT